MRNEGWSDKLTKIVDETVAAYPEAWKYYVCAFQIFNKKSGSLIGGTKIGTVCHAALSYGGGRDDAIVVNAHKADWQHTNKDFLLWVANDCPFSHGIVNRDDDTFLNNAGVIDTSLVGMGGALWICKALRHFEEDAWKIKRWSDFREKGLDGLQAFIGADILTEKGTPSKSNTHVSLFCYNSAETLREFYDEIRNAKKIESGEASRGGYAFGYNPKPEENREWGSLKFKIERKPDGWGGYFEKEVACDPQEYVDKLKEIFEGNPENVYDEK